MTKKTVKNSLKYHELFNKKVYSIVSKSNKLILGHTHIPVRSKYYINTGTFLSYDVTTINDYCIISDLHIGGELWNIKKNILRPKLIKLILRYKNKLILNGDVFELWLENPKTLIKQYKDIIKLIKDNGCIYIAGNHDYDIHKYTTLKIYDYYMINDWKVQHGWEYDPMNNNFWLKLYYKTMIHIGDNIWWIQKWLLPYRNKLVSFFWKK